MPLIFLALAGLGACREREQPPAPEPRAPAAAPSEAPAPPPKPPPLAAQNVLLITIDALRADQPWVGYTATATPNLDRLAKASAVYTGAYSLANTTGPSLGAMLAARYPSELPRDDCPLAELRPEDGVAPTLSAAGVRTMASHGHVMFAGKPGLSKGFAEWKLVPRIAARLAGDGAVTGEDVATNTLALLRAHPKQSRFFAWAHFVDPHDAYVDHADFPKRGSGRRARYDSEVAYTDHQVGRVLAALGELGFTENTAVIVTADHGEAFGEHGTVYHGFSLYEEEIRVPLLLHVPGQPGRTIRARRSLLDIGRTVAELLSVPAPDTWRGVSLLRDLEGDAQQPRDVLVDCPKLMSSIARRAFISGNDKVILEGGTARHFQLTTDPEERQALKGEASDAAIQRARAGFEAVPFLPAQTCRRQAFR